MSAAELTAPPEEHGPVSCPACGTANDIPTQAPPAGDALVCHACGAAPLSQSPPSSKYSKASMMSRYAPSKPAARMRSR